VFIMSVQYFDLEVGSTVIVMATSDDNETSVIGSYTGTLSAFNLCKNDLIKVVVIFVSQSNTIRTGFRLSFQSGLDFDDPCNGSFCQGRKLYTASSGLQPTLSCFAQMHERIGYQL
jgi:hypothetical protein